MKEIVLHAIRKVLMVAMKLVNVNAKQTLKVKIVIIVKTISLVFQIAKVSYKLDLQFSV